MLEFKSHSEEETRNIAKKFAEKLKVGDIVVLSGDLGTGKTKFTQGILSYFDLEDEISSPTFTIVNEYNAKDGTNIYHFDVYRLSDSDEFLAIGGEEYFEKGICIIEWGEMIEDVLPANYTKIIFGRNEDSLDERILKIENFGDNNLEF